MPPDASMMANFDPHGTSVVQGRSDSGSADLLVHVLDDDRAVCRAMALLLTALGMDARTYASAADFLDTRAAGRARGPEVVLTDLRMPGVGGLDLLVALRATEPDLPVIVMSGHGDVATAVHAMKAGAVDFLEKPFEEAALTAALRRAREALSPVQLAESRRPELALNDNLAVAAMQRLSPREREVLLLLMEGNSNKCVARHLGISPRTVEIHRAHMLSRLGVRSLPEAVRVALRAEVGSSAAGASAC